MKKILCFILLFVLFLTPALAYADDPSEDTSPGSSAVPEELENDFRRTAENLYMVLSDNGTRATPHDVNDVYNLIVQIFYNQANGTNEVVVIRQKLASIDTYCYTIMNNVTSINTTLSNFYNSINPDYDQTGISIYDLIHTFYDSIFYIDGTDGDISLMELLLVIEDEIENVELQLTSIINSVASIDSKCSSIISTLNTLNTNLINVYSAIQNQSSLLDGDLDELNANAQLIISRLQSLQNDFNNITWSNSNFSYLGFKTSLSDSTYNSGLFNHNDYPTGYFYFSWSNIPESTILKITLCNFSYSTNYTNKFISSIQLVNSNNFNYQGDYYIEYDNTRELVYIYISNFGFTSSPLIIKVNYSFNYYVRPSSDSRFNISYINSNSLDYYIVQNYLTNDAFYNKWKYLYASDDLIKAKEAQQATEDKIIEDFTGSGAGSISLSDAIVAKDTSSAIKSGFNTGASASKALNALDYNNPAGLYIWFTQNVANYFTLYTPNRGTFNQTFDSIIWTDSTNYILDNIDSDYYRQLTQ